MWDCTNVGLYKRGIVCNVRYPPVHTEWQEKYAPLFAAVLNCSTVKGIAEEPRRMQCIAVECHEVKYSEVQ